MTAAVSDTYLHLCYQKIGKASIRNIAVRAVSLIKETSFPQVHALLVQHICKVCWSQRFSFPPVPKSTCLREQKMARSQFSNHSCSDKSLYILTGCSSLAELITTPRRSTKKVSRIELNSSFSFSWSSLTV